MAVYCSIEKASVQLQTFLPCLGFEKSLSVLDNQRLNAMRRESRSILTYIRLIKAGDYRFENQPTVRQWYGHEDRLAFYSQLAFEEWARRGYTNNVTPPNPNDYEWSEPAIWSDDESYHLSHRLVLCRKAGEHEQRNKPLPERYDYRLRWSELKIEDYLNCEYVWPTSESYKKKFANKFITGTFMPLQTVISPDDVAISFKPSYAYEWKRGDKSVKTWQDLAAKNKEYLDNL